MKLLCALMVGTNCLAWHPKGTRLEDVAYYGELTVVCEPKDGDRRPREDDAEKCASPIQKSIRIEVGSRSCAVIEKALNLNVGTQVLFSCTKKDLAEREEHFRRLMLSPMQRQHEGVK